MQQSTETFGHSEAQCDGVVDVIIPEPGTPHLVVCPQPAGTPPLVGTPGLQMNTTHGDPIDSASTPSQDELALIQDEPALFQDEPAFIQDEPALIQDESAWIQDESKLIQDLAMAPTAEMRRYRLGKSVPISDILWRCCKMLKNMWCLW